MQVAPAPLRLARHARLRDLMRDAGLDALLITSLSNVAYLTGLFASAAAVVLTRDRVALITDGRYLGIAKDLVADMGGGVELLITPASIPFDQVIAESLGQAGNGRAGFEVAHLTVKRYRELTDRVAKIAPGCALEGTEGLVERLTDSEGRLGAWGLQRMPAQDFRMPLSV